MAQATLTQHETWRAYVAAKRAEDPEEAVAMGHPRPPRPDDAPREEERK